MTAEWMLRELVSAFRREGDYLTAATIGNVGQQLLSRDDSDAVFPAAGRQLEFGELPTEKAK